MALFSLLAVVTPLILVGFYYLRSRVLPGDLKELPGPKGEGCRDN